MKKHPLQRKLTATEAEAYLGPDFMNLLRQQFLIVLVNKLGGSISIPVADVDGTGAFVMGLEVDQVANCFILKTEKKQ